MKISRLAAVLVTMVVLVCACFAAEAINRDDLIACWLGQAPEHAVCPEEVR